MEDGPSPRRCQASVGQTSVHLRISSVLGTDDQSCFHPYYMNYVIRAEKLTAYIPTYLHIYKPRPSDNLGTCNICICQKPALYSNAAEEQIPDFNEAPACPLVPLMHYARDFLVRHTDSDPDLA